jgi:hypothetical protein
MARAPKNKWRTPTWLVGSLEAKKVPGLARFYILFDTFLSWFWTPLTEKRPKTWLNKIEKTNVLGLFCRFFCNFVSTRLFCKTFFVVFLNFHRHRWEKIENAKKQKKSRKNWNRNFCRFFRKTFGLFAKMCLWRFGTPLIEKPLKM